MDWKIYFIPNGLASHIKRLAEVYNALPGVFGRQGISRHLMSEKGQEQTRKISFHFCLLILPIIRLFQAAVRPKQAIITYGIPFPVGKRRQAKWRGIISIFRADTQAESILNSGVKITKNLLLRVVRIPDVSPYLSGRRLEKTPGPFHDLPGLVPIFKSAFA